jgi:hypothetical protein
MKQYNYLLFLVAVFTITTLSTAVKAHGDWIKPVSVHAACHSTHSGKLIDGNTDTTWHHWTKEVHWITLDMGSSYPIDTIRLYHKQWAFSNAIAAIYISDNPSDWGDSLGALPKHCNEATGWKENSITPKTGRYIKLVSEQVGSPYWREIEVSISAPSATLTAKPDTLVKGQSATLTWTTTHTQSVIIDQEIGPVAANDAISVSPAKTTTYTLTATGPGGTATASVTITVKDNNDSDADGLPDDWEAQYTGSDLSILNGRNADADNDQISNWIEYKLGTNPIANEDLQLGTHYQYDPLGRAKKIERIPSQ